MTNICPVCGYPELSEPAYDGDIGSHEICASCGFQFGWTDDDQDISHEEWRKRWIDGGMKWDVSGKSAAPINWDPRKQLLNIGIKI